MRGEETCDEGALEVGCASCRPRAGYVCMGEGPGACGPICGDGRLLPQEACDDGNVEAGDGCGATCAVEDGFRCDSSQPTSCAEICGDGLVVGHEGCDDGNDREGDGCTADCVERARWRPIPGEGVPSARGHACSLWTGREMFVWGGQGAEAFLNDGGLYDPRTRTWRKTNAAGAPTARVGGACVWTGTEVIIWSGFATGIDAGARYDPIANAWRSIATDEAVPVRRGLTANWTGREMIVFGGDQGADFATHLAITGAGAYDPVLDAWRTFSTGGEPSARYGHSSVWTGSELIIFGGEGAGETTLGDGGIYDPSSDTWRPISLENAPSPRKYHAAVWTGREMIVFGGEHRDSPLADGAAYDPALDVWRPISPLSGEGAYAIEAVWTGDEMIVWGGGLWSRVAASYIPALDRWVELPSDGAPELRGGAAVVLSEDALLIFGGVDHSAYGGGAVLDLQSRTWSSMPESLSVGVRSRHTAVGIGQELFIWGGERRNLDPSRLNSGVRMNVVNGRRRWLNWVGAPMPRTSHTAVAAGERGFIVWGGEDIAVDGTTTFGDGAFYDIDADRWIPLPSAGAPTARSGHSAIWTGTEMIVWGGADDRRILNDGARFDPVTHRWSPMADAPATGCRHTVVWTGAEMIVWGGLTRLAARYDPVLDRWSSVSSDGAPSRRHGHSAVWTGTEMIVWGGYEGGLEGAFDDGARYDPLLDRWRALPREGAASPRTGHTATWSGAQMMVFGGRPEGASHERLGSGARYDPALDAWLPMSNDHAPTPRDGHSAVWLGSGVVVWGGTSGGTEFDDGGIFDL